MFHLHAIVQEGRIDDLELSIRKNQEDLNQLNDEGYSPLHLAIISSSTALVERLLKAGSNPNQATLEEFTPLSLAIKHFVRHEIIRLLLSYGAQVNQADSVGRTALHMASFMGKVQVVRLLLTSGGSVDAQQQDGWSPLHCATVSSSTQVIDLLLDSDAAIDCQENRGHSPLHFAVLKGDGDLVKHLIAHKANMNLSCYSGWTPLMSAALGRHQDVLITLLDNGADTDWARPDGLNVLELTQSINWSYGIYLIQIYRDFYLKLINKLEKNQCNNITHNQYRRLVCQLTRRALDLSTNHVCLSPLFKKLYELLQKYYLKALHDLVSVDDLVEYWRKGGVLRGSHEDLRIRVPFQFIPVLRFSLLRSDTISSGESLQNHCLNNLFRHKPDPDFVFRQLEKRARAR